MPTGSESLGHIIIAGNIAAGKTTLTQSLASALRCTAYVEPTEQSPYLRASYEDPQRWSLSNYLWFYAQLWRQHAAISLAERGVQDHSMYEAFEVYARVHHAAGRLSDSDLALVAQMHELALASLSPPDIVLRLVVPTGVLVERIRARGRPYEQVLRSQDIDALERARDRLFESWSMCPIVTVDATRIDVRDATCVAELLEQLRSTRQ
jgi:deoxyadenosine/deoxycytidine kinase